MLKTLNNNSIVSIEWLKENLAEENLVILDASMRAIGTAVNAVQENPVYMPGSLRFDFDDVICDQNTSLPHMMPSPDFFTEEMQKMGINENSIIIVYDKVGIYSSPRAWWMFRSMGHTQVAVLDGGLPAWVKAGYDVVNELKAMPAKKGDFISKPQPDSFVDSMYVLNILNNNSVNVIDARSEGRFKGLEPEPRPGVRRGHIPNSVNIPYTSVLENGKLKSASMLRPMFEKYKNKKLIFSCGSGVTACLLALAAQQVNHKNFSVYDGSWSEWGLASSSLPVETA